jgi:hypothetical protein
MTRLKSAFNLFQPWADEVATGAMPYLIRQINTKKRERVGIYSLNKIDGIWLQNADDKWKKQIKDKFKFGLIGSVEIKDIISVSKKDLISKMEDLIGKHYLEKYYPEYLIPSADKLYIWVLKNPKKWKQVIPTAKGGINWTSIDLIDK